MVLMQMPQSPVQISYPAWVYIIILGFQTLTHVTE